MNRYACLHDSDALEPFMHTAARLRKRYKIHLTPEEYLTLCGIIWLALPDLETRPSGTIGRVKLWYFIQGKQVLLVFDPRKRLIITALEWRRSEPSFPERKTGVFYTLSGRRRKVMDKSRQRTKGSKYPERIKPHLAPACPPRAGVFVSCSAARLNHDAQVQGTRRCNLWGQASSQERKTDR